jgi:hypothetical protein
MPDATKGCNDGKQEMRHGKGTTSDGSHLTDQTRVIPGESLLFDIEESTAIEYESRRTEKKLNALLFCK